MGVGTLLVTDRFARSFEYLRLSITDACHFRCRYCLPEGYQKTDSTPHLTLSEISRLARAFAELGFWKFRITGGEPTLRPDFLKIAETLAKTPGVRRVAVSTNGFRLAEFAASLKDAGVSHINVSIDSLDPERFYAITGRDVLSSLLAGLEKALSLGLSMKVNTVLLKDTDEKEVEAFVKWIEDRAVCVRFIELMQTGRNEAFFKENHQSATSILQYLLKRKWKRKSREGGSGPAVEFTHAESRGTIGIIAPYSSDFCVSCNRLRITSRGGLKLCLFGDRDYSLRHWLQSDDQKSELQKAVMRLLSEKRAAHLLQSNNFGSTQSFSMIGG